MDFMSNIEYLIEFPLPKWNELYYLLCLKLWPFLENLRDSAFTQWHHSELGIFLPKGIALLKSLLDHRWPNIQELPKKAKIPLGPSQGLKAFIFLLSIQVWKMINRMESTRVRHWLILSSWSYDNYRKTKDSVKEKQKNLFSTTWTFQNLHQEGLSTEILSPRRDYF